MKNNQLKRYMLLKEHTVIAEGTIDEISKATGLKKETLRFYGKASYHNRAKKPRGTRKVLIEI